jgi:hypothetical protein
VHAAVRGKEGSMGSAPVTGPFTGRRLSHALADVACQVLELLDDWPADDLLGTPEPDVVEQLVGLATFEVPSMARASARLEPPAEIKLKTLSGPHSILIIEVPVTRFTLVVPVTGELSVLGMTVSRFSRDAVHVDIGEQVRLLHLRCGWPGGTGQGWGVFARFLDQVTWILKRTSVAVGRLNYVPIQVEIDEQARALRLYYDDYRIRHDPRGIREANRARRHFERLLSRTEQKFEWTRMNIQAHNERMAKQIPVAVAQRRANILNNQNLHASIGYPITKRPDASSHEAPLRRRKIAPDPARPSERSNACAPEPAIAGADYEAVLAVLRNARNALERSPSMSAKLEEEEIRDLLLVMLNAQFEGKAAGEVFNCAGRTDILVRDRDRNVFIGECKIFDPKNKQSVDHVVTTALDQLLGYLAWRDTKAALLLLIRDATVSAVVDKALTAIGGHPNHKRPGKVSTEERHDFVLHAKGDTNREIHLAFLPFLIAGKSA